MPLPDKRLPLRFPAHGLLRSASSPPFRSATGTTARSTRSTSSSSATGSRSSISATTATCRTSSAPRSRRTSRAIGISSYNGGHVEFFAEVVKQLRKRGADDIAVFGGGGGTITHDDQRVMQKRGVDKIFFAGHVAHRHGRVGSRALRESGKRGGRNGAPADMQLARKLTQIEDGYANGKAPTQSSAIEEVERHARDRLHRPRRRGQDDADRRARPALAASRSNVAHRDPFARSERRRRRRAARRPRHDDQLAARPRLHAQHGHARPGWRFVARDGRLPRNCWRRADSITSSSRPSAPARKRCRSGASSSTRRCWS